jgi:hypothetical protein
VDSNILITPSNDYYSFDFRMHPYWNFFKQNVIDGNIIILDKVYDETIKGKGPLAAWI